MSKTDIVEKDVSTDVAFLEECAAYFERRPTDGEDKAHWANVYNAKNCRKAADTITRLRKERDEAVADTIEKCLVAVRGSELLENLDNPEDRGYMNGIREACEAIRALTPDKED